jgi:hypothetical protein
VTKWFAKANDDVISHCRCEGALAATEGQFDCPWCGCGWLISCIECRKAFTFAKIVDVDSTYEEILTKDAKTRGLKTVTPEDIAHYAATMRDLLAPLELGATIVYLDGRYFQIDETDIEFEGFHARHKLDRLPHALTREDPDYLLRTLGDMQYWSDRERPNRHDDR